MRTLAGFVQTERELAAERASALARIGEHLECLLVSLRDIGHQCAHTSGSERARAVTEYQRLHEEARRYRWYLEVQRESVGLCRHDALDRIYPLPSSAPPAADRP